jgi:hypothetical protein
MNARIKVAQKDGQSKALRYGNVSTLNDFLGYRVLLVQDEAVESFACPRQSEDFTWPRLFQDFYNKLVREI